MAKYVSEKRGRSNINFFRKNVAVEKGLLQFKELDLCHFPEIVTFHVNLFKK
jgi:hypothetical protein